MSTAFEQLKPEYTSLLSHMRITRQAEIDLTVNTRHHPLPLLDFIVDGNYHAGCNATGVPEIWAAASFEREASSNFALNPAQGWPLHSRSRDVPYNGPFQNWTQAQIAAYRLDGLDRIGKANWSWERACYETEAFNGFGYRAYGVHSPYLWAGSNIYTAGKYVADGKFNRAVVDTQLGVIPMMVRMVQLRPDLALPFPLPVAAPPSTIILPPKIAPIGLHGAGALQLALNKLHIRPPLVVDNNYGRNTRRAVIAFQETHKLHADGLAGPNTWAAIEQALEAAGTF